MSESKLEVKIPKDIKLVDFIEEACELLEKASTIYEIRINGSKTSVVINKNNKEDGRNSKTNDSSGS